MENRKMVLRQHHYLTQKITYHPRSNFLNKIMFSMFYHSLTIKQIHILHQDVATYFPGVSMKKVTTFLMPTLGSNYFPGVGTGKATTFWGGRYMKCKTNCADISTKSRQKNLDIL